MSKYGKWSELLEFSSVKTYLMGAIDSKSAQIGSNVSFEEKLQNCNLTNYLKGVEIFFEYSLYSVQKDENGKSVYDVVFKSPSDIIDHWKEIRDNTEKVAKFKQLIETYIVWLKNHAREGKGYSGNTAMNYQAHLRGLLRWNDIIIKFRNYKERSEKKKKQSKFGVKSEDLKDMSNKVIGYIKDFETKGVCKILLTTGLGSREVRELTFGDIRYLNWDEEYVYFEGIRVKTGQPYGNCFYEDTKEFLMKWIEQNTDKKDEDNLFGNNLSNVYQKHQRIFRTAFNNMIHAEYPRIKDTSFFTMHSFRGIFITACQDLRVPQYIEDFLVAHASDNLKSAYNNIGEKAIENFKLVQNEIFGIKQNSTMEEAKKQIITDLLNVVNNDGKRTMKYREHKDTPITELTTDIRTNVLIESIINKAIMVAKAETIAYFQENFILTPK